MIRVTHIVVGLGPGGAETMLAQVVTAGDARWIAGEVISLTTDGQLGEQLRAAGIRVRSLGIQPGHPNPLLALRLARWLRQSRPHVVQTWMYHADLLGGLCARLAGAPVVWGIHHSNLDPAYNKRRTLRVARLCARLSRRVPAQIVCCSAAARRAHVQIGYAAHTMHVIPNGFDLRKFRPWPGAAPWLRTQLGLPPHVPLIGMAARFHPLKDHANFVRAAAHLQRACPEVNFLLCGQGITPENRELVAWITAAGLGSKFHLLGHRQDMARVYAGLTIASSSSRGDAFPLAVGEAMACGTPCAVTDVGDSALLVGDTGRVVPPENPIALANVWRDLLQGGSGRRAQLGRAARRRIEQRFSLAASIERYHQLYRHVAGETQFAAGVAPAAALPG